MTVKTDYRTYENCYLFVDKYVADESIAIEIWNDEEGPVARITTCLDKLSAYPGNLSFVDTNNCPWAEKFIETYHLGKPTGAMGTSGFCEYPLYEFDLDEIRKHERQVT